ncbi:hypothetical protein BC829DRAFT_488325, partial [Chytridium lagenaria]
MSVSLRILTLHHWRTLQRLLESDSFVGLNNLAASNGTLTMAFEVGMCGGGGPKSVTRRVIVDVGECREPQEQKNNTILSLVNTWEPGHGFRSCESACRDAVLRINDLWTQSELAKEPTRLAIFTPSRVPECTAARLHLEANAFGNTPLATIDRQSVFSDERFALMVGDAPATC